MFLAAKRIELSRLNFLPLKLLYVIGVIDILIFSRAGLKIY